MKNICKYSNLPLHCVSSVVALYAMTQQIGVILGILICITLIFSQSICIYNIVKNGISNIDPNWITSFSISILYCALAYISSLGLLSVIPMISFIMIGCVVNEDDTQYANDIEQDDYTSSQSRDTKKKVRPEINKRHSNNRKCKVVEGRFATDEELNHIDDITIKKENASDDINKKFQELKNLINL